MATWMTKALEQKKGPPPVLRPDEEVEHNGLTLTPHQVFTNLEVRGLAPKLQEVAERYHCTVLEVLGPSRMSPLPQARAELWAHLREDLGMSYPRVAALCGVTANTVQSGLKRAGLWRAGVQGKSGPARATKKNVGKK